MKKTNHCFVIAALVGAVVFGSTGCAEHTATPQAGMASDTSAVTSSGTMKIDGEIISIPSPTLLATLLLKANIPFNGQAVNPLQNQVNYTSETKKALNLGVYGADLAYVANYEQGQTNSDYFNVIAKLAGELGVLEHLDQTIVSRLNNNINNRDSLMALNATFFHAADKYLKSNERGDLASLVLVGGWVEAIHLSIEPAYSNAEVRNRVGEQKYSARSIQNLINRQTDPSLDPIKENVTKLVELLSALESSYKYQKPITDSKDRITYFTSKTSILVSDQELADIKEQVQTLRTLIIQ
jgi:hypothetical protein